MALFQIVFGVNGCYMTALGSSFEVVYIWLPRRQKQCNALCSNAK